MRHAKDAQILSSQSLDKPTSRQGSDKTGCIQMVLLEGSGSVLTRNILPLVTAASITTKESCGHRVLRHVTAAGQNQKRRLTLLTFQLRRRTLQSSNQKESEVTFILSIRMWEEVNMK